jgi:hypothetical protein
MKEKGSGSGKEKKAIDMGIKILDINELEELLQNKRHPPSVQQAPPYFC